jgi:hypothetical protein
MKYVYAQGDMNSTERREETSEERRGGERAL